METLLGSNKSRKIHVPPKRGQGYNGDSIHGDSYPLRSFLENSNRDKHENTHTTPNLLSHISSNTNCSIEVYFLMIFFSILIHNFYLNILTVLYIVELKIL